MANKKEFSYINPCPVCGAMVEVWDICDVCGWQYSLTQLEDNPDNKGSANQMSLNEAREAYKQGKKIY